MCQDDISDFLSQCKIAGGHAGIIINLDKGGRAAGDAYVELETRDDMDTAISMHKREMGSKNIEVFEANRLDVEKAKEEQGWGGGGGRRDRERGGPSGFTEDGDDVMISSGSVGDASTGEEVIDEASGEEEDLMARLALLRGDPVRSGIEKNNNEQRLAIEDLSEFIMYDDQESNHSTQEEAVHIMEVHNMEVPPSGSPTPEKKLEDPEVVLTPNEDYEDSLAEKISKKVLERLGINSNNTLKSVISEAFNDCVSSNDQNGEDPACKWLDSEDHLTCESCLHLSTMEIPNHLKSLKRANFGVVSKNASKYNLKRSIRVHVNSPLHIWCENRLKEITKAEDEKNKRNLEAATLLATNAALCFKTFGSAKDFVRLNDKDNMTDGLTPAFKNDGSQEFFSYREIFFTKLSDSVKKYFQEKVMSFSVTLDKVTDQRVSYTVIVSYFFSEGRLYYLLNSVHKMKSDDYDGEDTAKMVTRVLMETLGLSLASLRQRIHHFVYDGVYGSPDERLYGGGGLSLSNNFAEVLGLEPGDISGNHDMSHNLQLVYSDVFKHEKNGDKKIQAITSDVYSIMSDYNIGQAGSIFMETAEEMNHVVLSNKSRQKTRFVRSDMRGLQTYMTNIPVFYQIQGAVLQECLANNDNTQAKIAKKKLRNLTNGVTLATVVGYCQLLDLYCECSLESQHSRKFPTSTLMAIMKLEEKLENLGKNWVWENKNLKFAGFGSPATIIQDLFNGIYHPYISSKAAVRSTVQKNISRTELQKQQDNILATGMTEQELQDLLNWNPPVAAQAVGADTGEVPVIGFQDQHLNQVETHMKKLAKSLHTQLSERLKIWPLLLSAMEGFAGDLDWVDDDAHFEEDAKEKLKDILGDLTGEAKNEFQFQSCFPAYQVFLKFARQMVKTRKAELEVIWEAFWAKYSSLDMFTEFIYLFQHVQVKSYSEAICETVGSVMAIHHGHGRNVHPLNFNKEIYLNFNLGPLHILKVTLIPAVVKEKLEIEKKGFVSKTSRPKMMKFGTLSSSIGNFRVAEERKTHLPLILFRS